MKAKQVFGNIDFKRSQKPSKSLDIGMTPERNRDLAMKMMGIIGLEPNKGPIQQEEDWFWIRFTKNKHRGEDYILWYVGEDFNRLNHMTSPKDWPAKGWSLQDISVQSGYILEGKPLEEIFKYLKDSITEDYAAEISRFNDKIDDMNQILDLIKKSNES